MVTVKYVFPGGTVPGKFYQAVYHPAFDAKHMQVVEGGNINWGDDHEVTISVDDISISDWYLQEWEKYKVKTGELE